MAYKKIIISGKVQGVGYRAALKEQAIKHKLSGYVKNLADGSVEALITGPPAAQDLLVAWCYQGPSAAVVTKVEETDWETNESYAGFSVMW